MDIAEVNAFVDKHAPSGLAFLTVGTTMFDALVHSACSSKFCNVAKEKHGITGLLVQLGRGSWPECFGKGAGAGHRGVSVQSVPKICRYAEGLGIEVLAFTFRAGIADLFAAAQLVISHAGTGSIFESLRAGRPPLVVINSSLMDNHQMEVAEALQSAKHLRHCTPSSVVASLKAFDPEEMEPLPPSDTSVVVDACREEAGLVPTDLIEEVEAELKRQASKGGAAAGGGGAEGALAAGGGSAGSGARGEKSEEAGGGKAGALRRRGGRRGKAVKGAGKKGKSR